MPNSAGGFMPGWMRVPYAHCPQVLNCPSGAPVMKAFSQYASFAGGVAMAQLENSVTWADVHPMPTMPVGGTKPMGFVVGGLAQLPAPASAPPSAPGAEDPDDPDPTELLPVGFEPVVVGLLEDGLVTPVVPVVPFVPVAPVLPVLEEPHRFAPCSIPSADVQFAELVPAAVDLHEEIVDAPTLAGS